MILQVQDFPLLIAALKAWERANDLPDEWIPPAINPMAAGMMNDAQKAAALASEKEQRDALRVRLEHATILRAQLILARDGREVIDLIGYPTSRKPDADGAL